MVMFALQKALLASEAGSARIPVNRALAVQVIQRSTKMFWVTKPVILRNVPITAVLPTPRLAEWRLLFAEGAAEWRGARGVGTLKYDSVSSKHKAGDTVLKVQAVAQVVLKEKQAPRLTRPRAETWDERDKVYRSYVRYRRRTKEELRKLAGIAG